MSNESTMNRESLLKTLNLVKPALAAQTFIPAYNHIAFDGDHAMTHNDITALRVRCAFPEVCCVPGELLIRALGSFSGTEVLIKKGGTDHALVIKSGRSSLKVPTMPIKSFPFDLPEAEATGESVVLDAGIIDGIRQCLVSAGTNPNHPAAMGITLDMDDKGEAVLFATDNYTISMHGTRTRVYLPGDAPVIMPTFFCNQLIALTKAFPNLVKEITLHILPGALLVEFGEVGNAEVSLFTKTIDDVEPMDFHKIIKKHVDVKNLKSLAPIPDAFDSAFSRQLLVLGSEADKVTKVVYEDGEITLKSISQTGESNESFSFDGPMRGRCGGFHIDPTLVVRGSKLCDQMYLGERVLVMAGNKNEFLHIIAHVSAPTRTE